MKSTKGPAGDLLKGATGDWEVVIGLEVHAQVASRAKLFSGASTAFGGEPNSHVSLVDAAMPGMLPVINEACIAQAVRTGLGLNARINLVSVFDRKNYFYPDLPQGYQISQYKQPIVGEGAVEIDVDGEAVEVGIERVHLEQDAGKLIHDQHAEYSLVDLNRAGVALMEIVSKPDMRSSRQAQAYVSKLRSILRYLGTSDADMEKGNLRADVNVSVRRAGDKEYGTRCEIKNVNSIRFIGQAIDYEARRQIDILEDGGSIAQETRLFDSGKGVTRSMRTKEEAHDYRYFPDPDLLPLELTQDYVDSLRKDLPELPDEKKARFMREYGLTPYDAGILVAERERADYFEKAYRAAKQNTETQTISSGSIPSSSTPDQLTIALAKSTANTLINELMGRLNQEGKEISSSPISPMQLGVVASLATGGTISSAGAKTLLDTLWIKGGDPVEIVEECGLKQISDADEIERIVGQIIAANPEKFGQLSVKPALLGWFVGQVMKATSGKANPRAVNETIMGRLDFSAELVPSADAHIFDPSAVAEFRARWRRKSGNTEIDTWDDVRLLEEAGLTVGGSPTFAGLVLLGTEAAMARHLANAETIFEYRNFEGSIPFQQRKEFRRGFFAWADEIWNLVNLRNEIQTFRVGLFKYDIPTFDEDSTREAILNAVAHRDYREEGSIWIKQFPRWLEIESPGGLPEGITPENMLVRQKSRNRRICEALAKCGLVERSGQGMDLMVRQSILQGKLLPDPTASDPHRVVLRLSGEVGDPRFLRYLEQVGDEQLKSFSTDDILAIDLIHREQALPQRLEPRLPRLIDAGVIERSGRSKLILSRKFYAFLGETGVHTRKKGLDRETEKELLLRHLREAGAEGAPLKELLQVLPHRTRDQVRAMLNELRNERRARSQGQRATGRWFASEGSDLADS